MRLVRSLLSLALPSAASVVAQSPGTPPSGITNFYALTAFQTMLNTIVTPGDIVLLKHGASQSPNNWAAIVRFGNHPTRESLAGYATLYQAETTGFGTMMPSANAVYVRASSSATYKAGGTTYKIHVTRF